MSPSRGRAAVVMLQERLSVSERRACRVTDQHRSTQRHRPRKSQRDDALRARLRSLSREHPRWGYRRVWSVLRAEGWRVNRKRIERLWRLEGHRVPPRRSQASGKRAQGSAQQAVWNLPATKPMDVWSYDFMGERTRDGGSLRILNVVDEYTRVALGSRVDRSIGASDVQAHLSELFARHGKPRVLRSDNGREFIAATLQEWLEDEGVARAFIEKGSPQQNAFVERFNGTMRDEVLNGEEFESVLEARVVISGWVDHYNTERPHRGLGMMTPAAYAAAWKEGRK